MSKRELDEESPVGGPKPHVHLTKEEAKKLIEDLDIDDTIAKLTVNILAKAEKCDTCSRLLFQLWQEKIK